jgi:transcriptional regulator with XRE-family HTH domain
LKTKVGITMSDVIKIIGQRIRNHRTAMGLSQEKLAELCGCHPTYIGQIERGEKNATIESIARIASALGIPISRLFEKLGDIENDTRNIPHECYEFLSTKSEDEQAQLMRILTEVANYKKI